MSSDAKDVQNALHRKASVPGNFNLQTGKWEATDDKSETPRTKLVFHLQTKKLLAFTPQQAEAEACKKMDEFVAVDMAHSGFFNPCTSSLISSL
jgi:hypothetical protein